MMHNSDTMTNDGNGAASLYDRFAQLYDLTFKFNGYGRSLERYMREHLRPLDRDAQILDAGCGTGLLTLALLRTLKQPVQITAVDLSAPSLDKARQAVNGTLNGHPHQVSFMQANVLNLPFPDQNFDLIVTSGALEYVPLDEGMRELARVLKIGGHMLHLPVRPSPASTFLELLFRFKTHPPQEVDAHTNRYFRLIEQHRFPPLDIIGWTKTAILAQK